MEEQTRRKEAPAPEIQVTAHYADQGPSLEACMVSILGARLSKGGPPEREPL